MSAAPRSDSGRGAAVQPRARAAGDGERPDQGRDPRNRAGLPPAVQGRRRQRQPRAAVRARQGRHPRTRRAARDRRTARRAGQQPEPALPHPARRIRAARPTSASPPTRRRCSTWPRRSGARDRCRRNPAGPSSSCARSASTADEPVIGYAPAAESARRGVRSAADRPREGQSGAVPLPQAGGGGRARTLGDPARARAVPGPLAPVGGGCRDRIRQDLPAAPDRRPGPDGRRGSRAPRRSRREGAQPTSRALAARNVATVEVVPRLGCRGAAGEPARRRARRRTGSRVHFVDVAILADELAGFGPEVRVVAPDELRDAVIERLERTAADHG